MVKLFCLLSVTVGVLSCQADDDLIKYVATIADGMAKIPECSQVERHLGDADHFIVHFGSRRQPLEWQTEVFFKGRYSLTMVVNVTVDYDNNKIVKTDGKATFFLIEYKKIEKLEDGRFSASVAMQKQFGLVEWNEIVSKNCDFGVVGVKIEDSPIPHFPDYVMAIRRDRVHIPKGKQGDKK